MDLNRFSALTVAVALETPVFERRPSFDLTGGLAVDADRRCTVKLKIDVASNMSVLVDGRKEIVGESSIKFLGSIDFSIALAIAIQVVE